MSEDGKPDFKFYIFDQIPLLVDTPYSERIHWLENHRMDLCVKEHNPHLKFLPVCEVCNVRELKAYLRMMLNRGFEGIVARTPSGPYKYGRPTWKEQYAIKFKPFEDAEAKIVGFQEELENLNTKTKNELGYSQRSSHKDNFKGKNTLGALIVNTKKWGRFNIGTGEGLDHALRRRIWKNRKKYLGKIVKFRYQLHGTKDKPRIPIFIGFRDKRDM